MPIVTPNWNLPTPALTDAYNLVGDLATFSSAVDGALTSVANAFKGTSAQRIAAAATSVDGVLWQDTDGIKMIWRRDGSVAGSWAPAVTRWVGTTVQMNAFTQAPNGFEWFNTSDNMDYIRLAGAWSATDVSGYVWRNANTLTLPINTWTSLGTALGSPTLSGGITWNGTYFTVPETGVYEVGLGMNANANCLWAIHSTATPVLGTLLAAQASSTSGGVGMGSVRDRVRLVAGGQVRASVYSYSASSLTVNVGGFNIVKVA